MTETRKKPTPSLGGPSIIAGLPAVIEPPQPAKHRHQNLDRSARTPLARLSGGMVEIVVRKDGNRDRISQAFDRDAAAPLWIACRVNDEARA